MMLSRRIKPKKTKKLDILSIVEEENENRGRKEEEFPRVSVVLAHIFTKPKPVIVATANPFLAEVNGRIAELMLADPTLDRADAEVQAILFMPEIEH